MVTYVRYFRLTRFRGNGEIGRVRCCNIYWCFSGSHSRTFALIRCAKFWGDFYWRVVFYVRHFRLARSRGKREIRRVQRCNMCWCFSGSHYTIFAFIRSAKFWVDFYWRVVFDVCRYFRSSHTSNKEIRCYKSWFFFRFHHRTIGLNIMKLGIVLETRFTIFILIVCEIKSYLNDFLPLHTYIQQYVRFKQYYHTCFKGI